MSVLVPVKYLPAGLINADGFMRSVCLLILSFFTLNRVLAQNLPTGFSRSGIGSNWNQPVGAAFSKDGLKLFVWEKGGKVYVCNRNSITGQYEKQASPVIDITNEVMDYKDLGLLGFAVDPGFNDNRFIYLFYVADHNYMLYNGTALYDPAKNDKPGANIGRITRYKIEVNSLGENIADTSSRFILLGNSWGDGIPVTYFSHSVGSLAFAGDGTLIASAGDGASYSSVDTGNAKETFYAQALAYGMIRPEENVGAFRAQMINSLSGKILRLNPSTGEGVPGNPYYSSLLPRSAASRVWALGFRNPFRFSIHHRDSTGNRAVDGIYVGDVGYNTWEELDIVDSPGTNYGWPLFEGQTATASYGKLTIANRDEKNPLYVTGSCSSPYFTFNELIRQPSANGDQRIFNPCNSGIEITGSNNQRYIHQRPALDWKHGNTVTRVGIFSGDSVGESQIGSVGSPVSGNPFAGTCSIGGSWYTGTSFPQDYHNTYLFADYGGKFIRRASFNNSGALQAIDTFVSRLSNIVCLAECPVDGNVVYIDIGAGEPVSKISYGGPRPPVAVIKVDKTFGPSQLELRFTGSSSYDPEHTQLSYQWDFGDGQFSIEADPVHIFISDPAIAAAFKVRLVVKDNLGNEAADSVVISVNNTPPVVNIISPPENSKYLLGKDSTFNFQAMVTDKEQSQEQFTYQWHAEFYSKDSILFTVKDTSRAFSASLRREGCKGTNDHWLVTLEVKDGYGLSGIDSSFLYPLCPGDILLPPVISAFLVSQEGNENVVQWRVESESNVKYYLLERGVDESSLITIGEIAAYNLSGARTYLFNDALFSKGTNYYRVKAILLNGTITQSKIIRIFNGSPRDENIFIWPNPVADEMFVSTSFSEGIVRIRIRSLTGQLFSEETRIVNPGFASLPVHGLQKLPAGTYILELKQGNKLRFSKFVKVRSSGQ